MLKKFFVTLLCSVLLVTGTINANALSRMNSTFWAIDNQYLSALENNDLRGIINYASQEIEILKNYPLEGQILECIAARCERVALSYEALGDYPNAARYFDMYAQYADALGWYDAVKIALAKKLQYTPLITLYSQTDSSPIYYNAKNEPETGVYFGITSDSSSRKNLENESMVLLYQEFGDTYFDWINFVLKDASQKGLAVEYALNLPREGNQLDEVIADKSFLPSLATVLANYPDVPIFLRFGAEMNIWNSYAQPDKFVRAFQKVATHLRSSSPNLAMVWSPNMVSSWNINVNDYYPGDEYVDWVGASLYLNKYFLGRDWSEEEKFNEVVFFAGDNSDPILALKALVDTYGNRKPIMLSESGVSHYVRTKNSDQTSWALNRLRQLYTYIPMVYPQVKLIAHFDKVIEHETNDYSLSENALLAKEYKSLTSSPVFIQKNAHKALYSYTKYPDTITVEKGDTLDIFAYTHIYKNDLPKLDFYLDGKWLSSCSEVGYHQNLDISGFDVGEHTLRVATDVFYREYTVNIVQNIKLYLDGQRLTTDVPPVEINGRTLVPIRIISEKLGARVVWHEETQSIDIISDDKNISMSIGNNVVSVNGQKQTIDVAPDIIDGRTMVPIRWVSETMLLDVSWNDKEYAVYISTQK